MAVGFLEAADTSELALSSLNPNPKLSTGLNLNQLSSEINPGRG